MDYDIFETELEEQIPLIKAFYELEINPWVFNKLQTVDTVHILTSFLLDTLYTHIVIKPKIKGDKFDLCAIIKDGLKFLGTVSASENIHVLRHITRIHKVIMSREYQLPREIYDFVDILSIDGSSEFSLLLRRFIASAEESQQEAEDSLIRNWMSALDEFFKIRMAIEILEKN